MMTSPRRSLARANIRSGLRWLLAPLLILLIGGIVHAKKQRGPLLRFVARLDGEAAGDQFGICVTCCDLDRDKRPEIIVGSRFADHGLFTDTGSVFIYSGRDGSLMKRLDGITPNGGFGLCVKCADVNGDRRPDIIVGEANQGQIHVYSGRDFSKLYQTNRQPLTWGAGFSLACGDINGDRVPDIIAGAPNFGAQGDGRGAVLVFSGLDGSLLTRLSGESSGDQFGFAVVSCDFNRDGRDDVIVGSRFCDPNLITDAGSVFVYSGRDGSLLARFDGNMETMEFGRALECCDMNRDRFVDLVVGANTASPNAIDGAGSIFVYSGRDGSLIKQFHGQTAGDHVGTSLACCRLDRGRNPDILSGGPRGVALPKTNEKLWAFSGKDGSVLQQVVIENRGDLFGGAVACCTTRSGKARGVIVGARLADPDGKEDAGSVYVYSVGRKGIRWGR